MTRQHIHKACARRAAEYRRRVRVGQVRVQRVRVELRQHIPAPRHRHEVSAKQPGNKHASAHGSPCRLEACILASTLSTGAAELQRQCPAPSFTLHVVHTVQAKQSRSVRDSGLRTACLCLSECSCLSSHRSAACCCLARSTAAISPLHHCDAKHQIPCVPNALPGTLRSCAKHAQGRIARGTARTQLDGRHRPVPRKRVVRRPPRENNCMDAGRNVFHGDDALFAGEAAQPPVHRTAFSSCEHAPHQMPTRHGLGPSTCSLLTACDRVCVTTPGTRGSGTWAMRAMVAAPPPLRWRRHCRWCSRQAPPPVAGSRRSALSRCPPKHAGCANGAALMHCLCWRQRPGRAGR